MYTWKKPQSCAIHTRLDCTSSYSYSSSPFPLPFSSLPFFFVLRLPCWTERSFFLLLLLLLAPLVHSCVVAFISLDTFTSALPCAAAAPAQFVSRWAKGLWRSEYLSKHVYDVRFVELLLHVRKPPSMSVHTSVVQYYHTTSNNLRRNELTLPLQKTKDDNRNPAERLPNRK